VDRTYFDAENTEEDKQLSELEIQVCIALGQIAKGDENVYFFYSKKNFLKTIFFYGE
jgi:hypothetical protein